MVKKKKRRIGLYVYSTNSLIIENPQGPEMLNTRAVAVVTRVSNKLTGRDFNPRVTLDVPTQVDKLIQQATSLENLCQCYVGW
jgi:FKBP12-rapamycin complex-associated protein